MPSKEPDQQLDVYLNVVYLIGSHDEYALAYRYKRCALRLIPAGASAQRVEEELLQLADITPQTRWHDASFFKVPEEESLSHMRELDLEEAVQLDDSMADMPVLERTVNFSARGLVQEIIDASEGYEVPSVIDDVHCACACAERACAWRGPSGPGHTLRCVNNRHS